MTEYRSAESLVTEIVDFLNHSGEAEQLWQILTALRGPDDDNDFIKDHTTARFRYALGLHDTGRATVIAEPLEVSSDETEGPMGQIDNIRILLSERWPGPGILRFQGHFLRHFVQGVNALRGFALKKKD
jgi:hypothetical protein